MQLKRENVHQIGVGAIRSEQALQERIEDMMIQVEKGARIENPREYEHGAVDQLRHLLELGSSAQRDPHRRNFYDIDASGESFYIHISPVSGNVVLLARWIRKPEECCVSSGHLVA